MAQFQEGRKKTGGRQKGSLNVANADLRKFIQTFLEKHVDELEECWQDVKTSDPGRALELFIAMASFCVPKLRAQEVSGPNSGPVPIQLVTYKGFKVPE